MSLSTYNFPAHTSLRQLDRPQYCLGCLRRMLGTDDDPITDDGLCPECAQDEQEGDLDRAADAAQDGNLTQAQSQRSPSNDPGNPLLGASLLATGRTSADTAAARSFNNYATA